jgi:hypothetical protein
MIVLSHLTDRCGNVFSPSSSIVVEKRVLTNQYDAAMTMNIE